MRKTRMRVTTVIIGLGLGFLVIWVRAGQLQLLQGAEHRDTAARQRTQRVETPAPRGTLFDRNGATLAMTRETFSLGVAPNELAHDRSPAEIAEDIELIARSLDLDVNQVRRAVTGDRYAYFRGPFSTVQIAAIREIPGVHPEGELSRFYPDADLARILLGRPPSEGVEPTGIERVMDSVLTGIPGSAVVLRDQRGRRYQSPGRLDAFPRGGTDVILTIDAEMQEIVESALADALVRFEAVGGDVVALDPRSGEILALASADSTGAPRRSPISNPYEPGSTAKLFAAAALLKDHLVTLEDSVWGEGGAWSFDGRIINDVHEVEWATLPEVIENSSNIGIVKFASRLSSDRQFSVLRDFGFGSPTGIELPGESRGVLRKPQEWSGFSGSSLAMGYEFAATPLQIAAAYGAIANDGLLLRPTLIRRLRDSDGNVVWEHRPEPVRRVITPGIADTLRQMLRGVVYRGSQAALTSYEVAGKTGTTRRVGDNGSYVPGSYNASFASLFPADDPQIVMVVKLEDPRGTYGAQTAAPVTREVLERLLASRTAALDRRILSNAASPIEPASGHAEVMRTVSFDLPLEANAEPTDFVTVPDVRGLSARVAVRQLHAEGLAVVMHGLGRIDSISPAPGDSLPRRSAVIIFAGDSR